GCDQTYSRSPIVVSGVAGAATCARTKASEKAVTTRSFPLLAEVEVDGLAEVHRDDELLLGDGPVRALCRNLDEAAGAELGALGGVGLGARSEDRGAGDDGDHFARRVGVGGNGQTLGEFHHHDERALGGIAALNGEEGALDG